MNKYPTGKGVWVWQLKQCLGCDVLRLAVEIAKLGCSWVVIKVANGLAEYNAELMPAAKAAFEGLGIQLWGYHYIYGGSTITGSSIAKAESDVAIRVAKRYNLAGLMLDAEGEYKRKGSATWADTYLTAVKTSLPNLPLGLCSYRWPSVHPEFPWANFLRRVDFHAPQVYWMHAQDSGVQLRRSVKELTALKALPIVPLGAAFFEHGWEPTVASINEFDQIAHQLHLPGVSWWCWDDRGLETHPAYYQAIQKHDWGNQPPPPKDWAHELTNWARSMGYMGPDPEA
jgi:hypothetical protein